MVHAPNGAPKTAQIIKTVDAGLDISLGKPSALRDPVRDVNGGFIADTSVNAKCCCEPIKHFVNQHALALLCSRISFLFNLCSVMQPPSKDVDDAAQ
ncbi:unnamed protein product [Schistocephalus solidus]|uniref:Aldedh domain-containing protein n=1 Tax=Schistocephalus solidus TaxID=70667 RepID=A0A183SWI4_SCHSO|nr:unnamed protein product [Schistocephalus solidus]